MPLAKVYPKKDILIHYELHGTGPKKLLLVMGFLTDSAIWESQWRYFEELGDFEVCSFDNRGIGGSSAPPAPYTTTMFAEDALALVDYLGWSSFHVIGLSMGGMIATELSLKVPERIITLQLIATHTGNPITSFPPLTGLARCIWALFIPPFKVFQPYANDNLLRTLYGQKGLKEKRLELYALHLERCTQCWKTPPQGLLGQLCAVGSHFVRKDHLLKLRYSGIPLSLLVGTEDILVRCENSHTLQRILGCPLVIFEGCGHNLIAEDIPKINASLHDHIQKVESLFEYKNVLDREDAIKEFLEKRTNTQALYLLGLQCSHRKECTSYILQTFAQAVLSGIILRLLIRFARLLYRVYKEKISVEWSRLFNKKVLKQLFWASLFSSYFRAIYASIFCIRNGYRAFKESHDPQYECTLSPEHRPAFPYGPIFMAIGLMVLTLRNESSKALFNRVRSRLS